jgi:sugar lactone lactonase YvrE
VADDLAFPNGCVITPDGRTLIVAESFGTRLTAFTIAPDGSLGDRRVWAQLAGVAPDGICLDADGAVWVASPLTSEVLRVRDGGAIVERIPTGDPAIACMLGGPARRTLFVLVSSSFDRDTCLARCDARVETVEVEIPGAGWP